MTVDVYDNCYSCWNDPPTDAGNGRSPLIPLSSDANCPRLPLNTFVSNVNIIVASAVSEEEETANSMPAQEEQTANPVPAAPVSESNTIRIGDSSDEGQTDAFIAGISGDTVAGGVGVIIDSSGHLGTVVSSERFKDEIKPMDKASEAILALKPVTFRYKHELDPEGIPQFGLVAEQVEKVNPDLVARDNDGKPYTVRYEAVNAMLLNEFLKEHCKVESLEKAMAEQQKENAAMRAMLKEQASANPESERTA